MLPIRQKKPIKKESEGCEIETRKTKTGKRIKFKGKCSREQINLLSKENEIETED